MQVAPLVAPFPIALLSAWLLWLAFRSVGTKKRVHDDDALQPVDPRVARMSRIRELMAGKRLDAAVSEARGWLRDSDARSEPLEPDVLTCFAEVLWAHLPGLPATAEQAALFGEELLVRIDLTPSTPPWTRFHTVVALARAAEAMDDPATAKDRYRAGLEIADSLGEVGAPTLVGLLLGLAAACQNGGGHDEALPYLERALRIQEPLAGNDGLLLEILTRTGWTLFATGNPEKARGMLERAVTVGRSRCSELEYASSGAGECLGRVLAVQGEIAAAVARLAETVDLEERVFGAESPALVSTLFGLSDAHAQAGALPEAVRCLERARTIHLRIAGGGHVSGLELTLTLAKLKFAQGQVEESRHLLEEELEAAERRDGLGDSRLLPILAGMAGTCRALHDPAREREALERALTIAERAHGEDAAELIPILEPLGLVVWNAGEWSHAQDINRRLVAIQRAHLGPEHPDLSRTLINHGIVTARVGAHPDAREIFSTAMDILEETPLPPREILERTVQVLEELQTHPLHGTRYRDLLPRARALRRGTGGSAPIARA